MRSKLKSETGKLFTSAVEKLEDSTARWEPLGFYLQRLQIPGHIYLHVKEINGQMTAKLKFPAGIDNVEKQGFRDRAATLPWMVTQVHK